MKLFLVSMECANIAEAGGVKNVTYSLCKEFSALGNDVTLFIPEFKCSSRKYLYDIQEKFSVAEVSICGKTESVYFTKALCKDGNFKVLLVNHPVFAEKEAVYTYTENEEKKNPQHKKGNGHQDALFIDILLQKSVVGYLLNHSEEKYPDIIHCQDASTAALPAFIKESGLSNQIKTVVTIHNAGPFYHHEFCDLNEAKYYTALPEDLLEKSLNDNKVEPFLIAANSGAVLTTVSESYADELTDPKNVENTDGLSKIFYERKIKIFGITNGFDFERYNPQNTELSTLPFAFDPEKGQLEGKYKCRKFFLEKVVNSNDYDTSGIKKFGKIVNSPHPENEVFISYHGRITSQKGISVLTSAIPKLLNTFDNLRFILAGQGESRLEEEIADLTELYSGKIVFLNGYNQSVVRMATAACDYIVLPSFFEPCGLEDFIAQTFGTIPIAHKTGGLNKIVDNVTGFLYEKNTGDALAEKISWVIMQKMEHPEDFTKMIESASRYIHQNYYWKTVVENKYLKFFEEILRKR